MLTADEVTAIDALVHDQKVLSWISFQALEKPPEPEQWYVTAHGGGVLRVDQGVRSYDIQIDADSFLSIGSYLRITKARCNISKDFFVLNPVITDGSTVFNSKLDCTVSSKHTKVQSAWILRVATPERTPEVNSAQNSDSLWLLKTASKFALDNQFIKQEYVSHIVDSEIVDAKLFTSGPLDILHSYIQHSYINAPFTEKVSSIDTSTLDHFFYAPTAIDLFTSHQRIWVSHRKLQNEKTRLLHD